MQKLALLVCASILWLPIACSSSKSPDSASDAGASSNKDAAGGGSSSGSSSGGGTDSAVSSGCTGSFSGAASGTIDCSVTIFLNNELDLSGTITSSGADPSWAVSMRFNATPEAKTYALADMKQVDTQIIANTTPSKSWDLHYDGTGAAPSGFSLTLTDAAAPHGTLSMVLADSGSPATTVSVTLTF